MAVTTTPFQTLVIAARQDLESTLASLDLIAMADQNEQTRRVNACSVAAKNELLIDLQQVLPDIYANTLALYAGYGIMTYETFADWFFAEGYNWDTIDSLMDTIANPTVLKDCFVACWKWKLYTMQTEDLLSSGGDAIKPYTSQRDYWESQYHARYEKAWRLLQFDINKDGIVQPGERARTRNVLRIR